MCNRICVCVCIVVLSFGYSVAQVAGVTRTGENTEMNASFLDQHGGEVKYPRLSRNGQILYYPPLVVLDSMRMASDNAALFYATVSFDGWYPVLSRGFEYDTRADFSSSERVAVPGTIGSFEVEVAGSLPNRDYYVRPYAVNAYGTAHGSVASFHTAAGPVVLDTLLTNTITPVSFDVAVEIADNGGAPLHGAVVAFADEGYRDTAAVRTLSNIVGSSADVLFSGLAPATDYFVRAILTNGRFSDTVCLRVHTPSDLTLTIEASGNPTVALCTGGNTLTYRAQLSGTDEHKPLYQYRWTTSAGAMSGNDSVFNVLYSTQGTYEVVVVAFYGLDTLTATYTQVISPQVGTSSFYVCTNEFLNTAEATTTNIASIRWLDEHNNVVDTKNSVKLPTGYYTVECTDNYGCVLSKEVYVGKKKLSCIVSDTPGSHESARYEDGVWKIDSISDEDGYWYAVTQIGRLCWLRQNLRTRHLPSTHQDLLGTGANHRPNMQYADGTYIYKPESTPYMGSLYTWCAAVDVPYAGYNYEYNFPKQHRGICPPGWHLPNKDEIWEIVDTMLNLCCEGVDYMPAPGTHLIYVAQNTPINDMMRTCCYDSYSNPSYPQEIYDAFNLSIPREQPLEHRFWLIDLAEAERTALALCVSNQPGIMIGVGVRVTTYMPVRCVRNYQEE